MSHGANPVSGRGTLGAVSYRVTLIACDTALTPDQGVTSGSQSHPANFNRSNLAQAGATARQTLLQLASKRLSVPVDQLTAIDGVIQAKNDASKKFPTANWWRGRSSTLKSTPTPSGNLLASGPCSRGKPLPRPGHARDGHSAI